MRRPILIALVVTAMSCVAYDPWPTVGFSYSWGDGDWESNRSPIRGGSWNGVGRSAWLEWSPKPAVDEQQQHGAARLERVANDWMQLPDGGVAKKEVVGVDEETGAEVFKLQTYVPELPEDPADWPRYTLLLVGTAFAIALVWWARSGFPGLKRPTDPPAK